MTPNSIFSSQWNCQALPRQSVVAMYCGLVTFTVYLICFPSFMDLLWLKYNIWKTLLHILCFYFKVVSGERVNLVPFISCWSEAEGLNTVSYLTIFILMSSRSMVLDYRNYFTVTSGSERDIRSFITFQLSNLFLERYPGIFSK